MEGGRTEKYALVVSEWSEGIAGALSRPSLSDLLSTSLAKGAADNSLYFWLLFPNLQYNKTNKT